MTDVVPKTIAPRATMKDVAALAGVSLKTVSRVINEEPSVNPEMVDGRLPDSWLSCSSMYLPRPTRRGKREQCTAVSRVPAAATVS